MNVYLKVPFSEKDEAKALGAYWDQGKKSWFVRNPDDLTPFLRWIPDCADFEDRVSKAKQVQPKISAGTVVVGSDYVHTDCDCCPPWELCEHSFPELLDQELGLVESMKSMIG